VEFPSSRVVNSHENSHEKPHGESSSRQPPSEIPTPHGLFPHVTTLGEDPWTGTDW
jgi:hypothetical protein